MSTKSIACTIDVAKCVNCGACVPECPQEAIWFGDEAINCEKCNN